MGVGTWTKALTPAEWLRLSGFGAAIALLHVAGWGLFLYYVDRSPALAGLGVLAYTFGLRHAFDADHIAAIDNTTRKMLQHGKRPLGVGFFFSLGHSTIVFGLALALALAAKTVNSSIPSFQNWGGYVGTSVSGTFLWIIGILNLLVLLDILRIFKDMRRGSYDRERLEQRLLDRGFMNRFFIGKLFRFVSKSWHMYPLGILFGLGFDTASEVGLLALAAGVATHHVPFLAVMSLPILFAAGMSLMDTIDGAFMTPGVRLGVLEPGPQGLLQHHRHEPLGRGRAPHRDGRAAAGSRAEALARHAASGAGSAGSTSATSATESSGSSCSPGPSRSSSGKAAGSRNGGVRSCATERATAGEATRAPTTRPPRAASRPRRRGSRT